MATVIELEIRPQPGPQTTFLKRTSVDISVYGGAAGAGKTWALLMEAMRHIHNPKFSAVVFRRTYPQIMNEGGLWDTSAELYPHIGGVPKESSVEWSFQSGATVRFAHMQHDKDRFQWDGAQIPLIGFDQLEHFSKRQFFYMLSRNRSLCGVRPYIRATANPNPDHWLRSFMAWWIDDNSGLPILSRAGVVRWFVVLNDEVYWADSREELISQHGPDVIPKSFTFVPGRVTDNKILMRANPEYLANLQALSKVDRERLLGGNWNIRESAGMFFQREWFEVVKAAPALENEVRYWDRAATEADKAGKGTSWTAGVRMGKSDKGVYYITDVDRFQGSPLAVEQRIKNVATQDGIGVTIGIEQDPGQAGKAEAQSQARNLAGYNVKINPVREAKGVRVRPFSAQAEAGNVKLVGGKWKDNYLRELENFDGTPTCVSDQTDASSGGFHLLNNGNKVAGVWGR